MLFTDLPAPTPENEAQWLASQPGLAETLRAQALTLKVQAGQLANLALASPEERREVERYKAVTNDKLRPTRDPGARVYAFVWVCVCGWVRVCPKGPDTGASHKRAVGEIMGRVYLQQ